MEAVSMSKTFPFLLNIGFGQFLPCPMIIAIFNAKDVDGFVENANITEEIFVSNERPVKSYVYCIGGYLVGSPIESKTLKGRYEKFQNEMNGLSDEKNLYIRIN
jgi:hypothetical protein